MSKHCQMQTTIELVSDRLLERGTSRCNRVILRNAMATIKHQGLMFRIGKSLMNQIIREERKVIQTLELDNRRVPNR